MNIKRISLPVALILAGVVLAAVFVPWAIHHARQEKISRLISKLATKDLDVRRITKEKLVKEGEPAVEQLITALKNSDARIRIDSAYALGRIKDRRAVEPLIGVLKDTNANARGEAAFALEKIKDPRALLPLIAALKDPDWGVRWEAAEALKAITGQNFGEDAGKWQAWYYGRMKSER